MDVVCPLIRYVMAYLTAPVETMNATAVCIAVLQTQSHSLSITYDHSTLWFIKKRGSTFVIITLEKLVWFLGHRLPMTYSRWNSGVPVRPSVRPQKLFSDFHLIWCVGRPRPDLRSRSRSRSFRSCENCTFLGLSPPPFWCGAQNWWLVAIVWDLN